MSAPEDVQAAELTELLREADAVAYSLREFLNQPILAKTVESLASRLAAETARADAAEEVVEAARWIPKPLKNGNSGLLADKTSELLHTALARYDAAKEQDE